MFELMGKEINAILGAQTILIWTYDDSYLQVELPGPATKHMKDTLNPGVSVSLQLCTQLSCCNLLLTNIVYCVLQAHRNLSQLPNFAFSVALALFHMESIDKADHMVSWS